MADENSPAATADNTANLPDNKVEAAPSAKEADSNTAAPAIANPPPADTNGATKVNDLHAPHLHHKWHAEVQVDGHNVYLGIAKDISINGLNLVLDQNLEHAKQVKLHIHIPPMDASSHAHIVEVSGKVISTVYDSDEEAFRSGISFTRFTLDSDRAYLQSQLA